MDKPVTIFKSGWYLAKVSDDGKTVSLDGPYTQEQAWEKCQPRPRSEA